MTDILDDDIRRYANQLSDVYSVYSRDPVLLRITTSIVEKAANASYDAGMGGSHSDGGASAMIDNLKMFLQGVRFGKTADTDNLGEYRSLHRLLTTRDNPKYQEYLKLKEEFGDLDD